MSLFFLFNPKFYLDPIPRFESAQAEAIIKKKFGQDSDKSEEVAEKLDEYIEVLSSLSEVQAELKTAQAEELLRYEQSLQKRRTEIARQVLLMQEEEEALMLMLLN